MAFFYDLADHKYFRIILAQGIHQTKLILETITTSVVGKQK